MSSSTIEVRLENNGPLFFTGQTDEQTGLTVRLRRDDMLTLSMPYRVTIAKPPASGPGNFAIKHEQLYRDLLQELDSPNTSHDTSPKTLVYVTGVSGYIQFGQDDRMRYPLYPETLPVSIPHDTIQMNVTIPFAVFDQHVQMLKEKTIGTQSVQSPILFQLLVVHQTVQVAHFFPVTGHVEWQMPKHEYYEHLQDLGSGMMDVTYVSAHSEDEKWLRAAKTHLQKARRQWEQEEYAECISTCRKVKEALFKVNGTCEVQARLQHRGISLFPEIDGILQQMGNILNGAHHAPKTGTQSEEEKRRIAQCVHDKWESLYILRQFTNLVSLIDGKRR